MTTLTIESKDDASYARKKLWELRVVDWLVLAIVVLPFLAALVVIMPVAAIAWAYGWAIHGTEQPIVPIPPRPDGEPEDWINQVGP